MELDFEEFEEYVTEVQNYRKNNLVNISNRYTNNGSQDFLIDMKTLKVIGFKDAEPRIPYYGTLTSYFCEPAHKMLEVLSSHQKKVKTTSQKEPLEWGKDSGIGTDTSGTAESSQESFTSSNEEFEFSFRGHDSKVSEDLNSSQKMTICDLSIGKHNSKVFEKDPDSSLKKSKWDLSIGKHNSKVFEKDLDSSLKKSKRALSIEKHNSKVFEKDPDSSLKKSKWALSIEKHNSKVFEKDLDSSLKKSKRDLSFGRYVFEKDFDSNLKKSKWGNKKPNVIPTRRNPAFNRDTSFLHNIPVDDIYIKQCIKIIK